ncbi:MAG TPA: aminoglycoside 6-adenylyltransferase [Ruminiclostridium sp.]
MRNEKEVLDQLLSFARNNEMIRAVILNGSRVNPNVQKDIFCDFDVVFAVTDPKHFLNNQSWIEEFGETIIVQQNKCSENSVDWFIFLMIFTDGIRIDLQFFPIEHVQMQYEDSLKVLLLDKDNAINEFELPNESFYFTKKPSKEEFEKTINNFWWCSTNVAKGIWRDELCYAKTMYEVVVRECIINLLSWYIGMNHNWCINTGKWGKWFKGNLPVELWNSFVKTYSGTDYNEIWESLLEACRLVRKIGVEVADTLGYEYPLEDDNRVYGFLQRVCSLPKDAQDI